MCNSYKELISRRRHQKSPWMKRNWKIPLPRNRKPRREPVL